jgi:hypothetical protein
MASSLKLKEDALQAAGSEEQKFKDAEVRAKYLDKKTKCACCGACGAEIKGSSSGPSEEI